MNVTDSNTYKTNSLPTDLKTKTFPGGEGYTNNVTDVPGGETSKMCLERLKDSPVPGGTGV